MVYPAYNNGILSKSPLVRIKFANLIVGKISSYDPGSSEVGDTSKAVVQDGLREQEGSFDVITAEGEAAGTGLVDFEAATVIGEKTSLKRGGLLGWIGGLSWKPNLEAGMFAMSGQFFPKVISMSFQFNVLHEETISQPTMADQNWPFGDDV